MNLTDKQKEKIKDLLVHRDSIINCVFHMERILKHYFPEEFDIAYQHWIPQIITALYDDNKWLPRGEQTFQDTINRLLDKSEENRQNGQSVSKFI